MKNMDQVTARIEQNPPRLLTKTTVPYKGIPTELLRWSNAATTVGNENPADVRKTVDAAVNDITNIHPLTIIQLIQAMDKFALGHEVNPVVVPLLEQLSRQMLFVNSQMIEKVDR